MHSTLFTRLVRLRKSLKLELYDKNSEAFRGMHVSPAKHSYGSVTDGRTDGQTDDGQSDPMCHYASQATQKQPTNKLKRTILSETSILYLIRHASFILIVDLHL